MMLTRLRWSSSVIFSVIYNSFYFKVIVNIIGSCVTMTLEFRAVVL